MAAIATSEQSEARAEASNASVGRALTPDVRKRVGLPRIEGRYPWARAVIASAVFGVPLVLAGWSSIAFVIALVALVVLPGWRHLERREARARESLYVRGDEAIARVLEIEPAGSGRRDHVVHVEYFVGKTRHEARIVAAPLARHGLRPGDDALVVFDAENPTRCLLVEKIARAPKVEKQGGVEIVDAVFDDDAGGDAGDATTDAPTDDDFGAGPIGGCGHGCGCR